MSFYKEGSTVAPGKRGHGAQETTDDQADCNNELRGGDSRKMAECGKHRESVSRSRQPWHWRNLSDVPVLEPCSLLKSSFQGKARVVNCS